MGSLGLCTWITLFLLTTQNLLVFFQLVGPEKEQYLQEKSFPVEGYSSLGTPVAFFYSNNVTGLKKNGTRCQARAPSPDPVARLPSRPESWDTRAALLLTLRCVSGHPPSVSARHESRGSEPVQNSPVSGLVLLRPPHCPVLAWSPPSHEDLHSQPWWPGAAPAASFYLRHL